jgi:hypothetical protein
VSGRVISVADTGTRGIWENADGQAVLLSDGLRARLAHWPPLRLVRLCREHESVCVVLPAASPGQIVERRLYEVDRTRRPSRLLRGRDQGQGCAALGRAHQDQRRRARVLRPKPCPRRPGGARSIGTGARDQAHPRAPRRAGGGRQHEEGARDRRGEGEDRQGRRQDALRAAPRGLSALRLQPRRVDPRTAPAPPAPREARAGKDAREERAARRAGSQPQRGAPRCRTSSAKGDARGFQRSS